MVSESNKKMLKEVKVELAKYPVIGLLDMHKMPAKQLLQIRNKLRGQARIWMVKKRVLQLALEQIEAPGAKELAKGIQGEPALILTSMDPFRLARTLEQYKSAAFAKPGDVAPYEILIKEGPTPLPPGPAIGDFQKLKIPAMVAGDKIAVRKDTVVAKTGDIISPELAGMLTKLGIEPMEVGLNMVSALERGIVYPREVMFVPLSEYLGQLKAAGAAAMNLSVNANIFTSGAISLIIAKAAGEARGLAIGANIITPETIGMVLAKADAAAVAVGKLIKPSVEEKKEETPAGQTNQEKLIQPQEGQGHPA
jgi:large subunit ribosomal protein L10